MTDPIPFTMALAQADDQPDAMFEALGALTDRVIGVKLFTLMTFDEATRGARRIHSNMPDAYPVKGTKPVNETWWTRHVLDEHRTFVANDIDSIAEVFDDHELIASLGCESVVNVPIVVGGQVMGTINCLHQAGHYAPERVAACDDLKLPGAAAFLYHATVSPRGA